MHLVLRVGDHEVTEYTVRRSFDRHFAGSGEPDAAAWFEGYLARQVLVAEALRTGRSQRAFVLDEVERMERHMLTQVDGPLYDRLCADAISEDLALQATYEESAWLFDATWIWFADDQALKRALGEDFEILADGERVTRLLAVVKAQPESAGMGSLCWPFLDFGASLPSIGRNCAGKVFSFDSGSGFHVVHVREARRGDLQPFAVAKDSFVQAWTFLSRRSLQASRKARLLREAGFALNVEVGRRVLAAVAGMGADFRLDPALRAALQSEILVRLSPGSGLPSTAGDFIRHLERQFVRMKPASLAELAAQCGDMVLQELDHREALRLGLHLDVRFCADRLNYRNALALQVYEDEVLAPRLHAAKALATASGAPEKGGPSDKARLRAAELAEARALAGGFSVVDQIDYAAFGVSGAFQKPWQP